MDTTQDDEFLNADDDLFANLDEEELLAMAADEEFGDGADFHVPEPNAAPHTAANVRTPKPLQAATPRQYYHAE